MDGDLRDLLARSTRALKDLEAAAQLDGAQFDEAMRAYGVADLFDRLLQMGDSIVAVTGSAADSRNLAEPLVAGAAT